MKKILVAATAMATAMALVSGAQAATTGYLDVQMAVVPGCAFSGGSGNASTAGGVGDAILDFGSVTGAQTGDVTATAVATGDGQALRVVCSSSAVINNPTISFDQGQNYVSGARKMTGPGGTLVTYELFQDAGRNTPYAVSTALPLVLTANVPVPVNIYGRVSLPSTALTDGLYTDRVTMTLAF